MTGYKDENVNSVLWMSSLLRPGSGPQGNRVVGGGAGRQEKGKAREAVATGMWALPAGIISINYTVQM